MSTTATRPPVSVPSRPGVLTALTRSLRSDLIKLTTLRSNTALLGLTIATGLAVTWGAARYIDEPMTVANLFTFSVVFTAVFAAIGGVLAITSEAQHGTLGPTLAAQPARSVVVGAKALVVAAFGALLGLAGAASGALGAALGGIPVGDTSGVAATTTASLTFTTLAAVLGLGVGLAARHSTAAVSGLLVWWLVVENLLTAFLDPRIARFLPFYAGNALVGIAPEDAASVTSALTRPRGAFVLAGYALIALAVGTAMLHRCDTR